MRSFNVDRQGRETEAALSRVMFAPPFPDYVEDVLLPTNTLVRVPIPANATFALFSFNKDFRCKPGLVDTEFTIPTSTTVNGMGSEMNPSMRAFAANDPDITHLCLRAPEACVGSIAFYKG